MADWFVRQTEAKLAAEMVINKKPASKVIKKPKTKTAKKRAR